MKAVAVTRPGCVEVVDIPMPHIEDYECLVRVDACGLCSSTDLKIIGGRVADLVVPFPVILGHEGVGTVVEAGPKVRNIRPGDRFLNPHGRIEPGTPYTWMWAGMVEWAIVQDREVMDELGVDSSRRVGGATRPIPPEIAAEDAAVLLTLKEACSAVRNFGFQAGSDALVYGDGPAGLELVTFLRRAGARWIGCVGHHDDRLCRMAGRADLAVNARTRDVAEALGERRVDLVIDAVGSIKIIRQGSALLKPGGKVGVYGVLKREHSELSLLDLKNHTAVHVLNWPYQEHGVHDEIVDLVVSGVLQPADFYSHVLPLADAARAVEMIRSREAFKVVLRMEDSPAPPLRQ